MQSQYLRLRYRHKQRHIFLNYYDNSYAVEFMYVGISEKIILTCFVPRNVNTYPPVAVLEIRIRNWSATFFEDSMLYGLLIAVPLKTYGKFGQPKWTLVSQMLKLVRNGQWSTYFILIHVNDHLIT